jgi:hypothetical protein
MVDQSTRDPKFEGSNPVTAGTERERRKKYFQVMLF